MHFVITHKPLPWSLPFDHCLISVGEAAVPQSIHASEHIQSQLALDHALGGSRASPVIYDKLKSETDADTPVLVSSYRMFLSARIEDSGFSSVPFDERFTIVPHEFFLSNHHELVLQEIPEATDIVIARPVHFSVSILEQYTAHRLEDLLKGVALAIEMGIIAQNYAAHILARPTLLPFGFYACRAELRMKLHEIFWDFVLEYYRRYGNNPARRDFQRRYIDFVTERVHSIFLFQYIVEHKLRFMTSRPIFISDTGTHQASR